MRYLNGSGCRAAPACLGSACANAAAGRSISGRRAAIKDANEVFKQLVAKNPKNPDYKVRWGRMYAGPLRSPPTPRIFSRKRWRSRRITPARCSGLALVAAGELRSDAPAELAKKALEIDPKLVEAQELLARLALEDNNNPKATEEAKKALAIDAEFACRRKAILATIDWLADKKETAWDPHDRQRLRHRRHTSSSLNRRYEEGIQYLPQGASNSTRSSAARARKLGINLMRLGQDDEARKQLEICFNNGYQDAATRNSLTLMDSYKNFVTFKTDHHDPEAAQEGSRAAAPVFRKRAEARHRDLREEVQDEARPARCRWRSIPTTRISPCARWACRASARWA